MGKIVVCVCRLDLLFVQPPPPAEPTRGSVPIGARGGRYPPTSLARQVGGASRLCEPDLATTGKLRYGQVPFRSIPRSGGIPPHGLMHGPPRVPTHAESGQEQLLLEEDRLSAAERVSRLQQTLRRSCSRRS